MHKVQGTKIMTSTIIVLTMSDIYGLVPWYKTEYLNKRPSCLLQQTHTLYFHGNYNQYLYVHFNAKINKLYKIV